MGVPLAHEIGAAEIDHQLAAAVMALRVPTHDSAFGPARRLALVQHRAARAERRAGIERAMEFQIVDAQEKAARLAQVLNRESEHRQEDQHRVQYDAAVAVGCRVLGVEVQRVEAERQGGEQAVVAVVERAAPMMMVDVAEFEILVMISLGPFFGPRFEIFTHPDAPNSSAQPLWRWRFVPMLPVTRADHTM